jgi:hypothetical protein
MTHPVPCSCGELLPTDGEVAQCPQCGRAVGPGTSSSRSSGRTGGRRAALAYIGAGVAGTLLGAWLLMMAVERFQDASDRTT